MIDRNGYRSNVGIILLNKKNEGISDYLDTLSESKDIKDIYNNITENSTEDCTENKMDPFSFFEDAAM